MDRFQDIRIFTRVVERRSFRLAAQDLNLPRATVTNAVQRLEAHLATHLIERTTRVVAPTPDGQACYLRCLRLLAELADLESVFGGAVPSGVLLVQLEPGLGAHVLAPALPAFLARYPCIELVIGEDGRDPAPEDVDCMLCTGTPSDSTMLVEQVASLERATCASPSYLARHGRPASLHELTGHRAVQPWLPGSSETSPLEFLDGGELRQVVLPAALRVSSTDMASASAIAGLGIVQAPRYRIDQALLAGQLEMVLAALPPPALPLSVLYPHNRQLSPRVRVFIDWIKEVFAERDAACPRECK